MEKDDEVKGSGNSYDFGARIYDPRLGRWLACDAFSRKYPDMSPFSFALNNPIRYIDPDGNVVVDGNGLRVKVKIKKDDAGNYVASYKFDKRTDQGTIDEFMANGGKVIDAMVKTPTGRQTVKEVNRVATKIHYTLLGKDDKSFVGTNSSGETGFTYGNTDTKNAPVGPSEPGIETKTAEITISLAAFEYGKTVDPQTGLGDPAKLPGGEGGAFGDMKSKDPSRLYKGSEEEFLNGVGTHESTHALNDLQVLFQNVGKFVTRALEIIKGKEADYYKATEVVPDQQEDKSRKEYNSQEP